MIPRAFIDAWRSHAPWRSDVQVEQDLIICRSLAAIYQHPLLSEQLAFRGGTALHKLHFARPHRYSEDIDLVQLKAGPIGPIFDALREVLVPLMGQPQRKQGPGVVTLTYRLESEIPPVLRMKLKVEINAREHFTVMGLCRKRFEIQSPWFTGGCDVATYDLHELLGTKLRALYQRRKGRDLYDLWLGLTEGKADPVLIAKVFRAYMEFGGQAVNRAEFAANLEAKRRHPGFAQDLPDLLPNSTHYDLEAAYALIEQELLPQL